MLFSSAVWFASGASLNTSIVLMVTFCWPRAELTSVVNKYLAHSSAYRATLLAGGAGGRDVGVTAMTGCTGSSKKNQDVDRHRGYVLVLFAASRAACRASVRAGVVAESGERCRRRGRTSARAAADAVAEGSDREVVRGRRRRREIGRA